MDRNRDRCLNGGLQMRRWIGTSHEACRDLTVPVDHELRRAARQLVEKARDVFPFAALDQAQARVGNRALAGLSMGGGQSLNFGLGNMDTFAWVGGFSSAPNTRAPEKLLPDPEKATQMLKLLWISAGDKDGLIGISQGVHQYLKDNNVPHIWHVDSGEHNFVVWKNDLYLFSQRIFR